MFNRPQQLVYKAEGYACTQVKADDAHHFAALLSFRRASAPRRPCRPHGHYKRLLQLRLNAQQYPRAQVNADDAFRIAELKEGICTEEAALLELRTQTLGLEKNAAGIQQQIDCAGGCL